MPSIGVDKVARVTFAFWVMKICATTVGETGGDLLSQTLNVGYAESSLIFFGFFAIALFFQLRATRYIPAFFWLVIVCTRTVGTTMSDFLDRSAGLGYPAGAGLLVSILILVLGAWWLTTGSLSVANISDRRSETFYWMAILTSNTLGTALGDFMSDSSGLGYGGSNLIITGLLAVMALCYFFTRLPRTALFWGAFVLTRPFGATMGDFLTKTPAQGGIGLGTEGSTAVLSALFVAMVAWTTYRLGHERKAR